MHKLTRPRFWNHMGIVSVLTAALLVLASCASVPEAPPPSLEEARDAIANAEQAEARQYASAELDEAVHKLELAERAMSAENRHEADQLAQESLVTAELALAKTAEAKAAKINRQLARDAEALEEELERMGDQR